MQWEFPHILNCYLDRIRNAILHAFSYQTQYDFGNISNILKVKLKTLNKSLPASYTMYT